MVLEKLFAGQALLDTTILSTAAFNVANQVLSMLALLPPLLALACKPSMHGSVAGSMSMISEPLGRKSKICIFTLSCLTLNAVP